MEKWVNFAWNCPKPRKNANLARENEQSCKFAKLMDFGDYSICEECEMICTDVYSDEEHEDMVVYGDQGITTEKYDEDMYGDRMDTDSDEDKIVKYNMALLANCTILGLTTLNSHLQYVNWLVWEVCSVN